MILAKDNPFGAHRLDLIDYIPQGEPLGSICNRFKEMDRTAALVGPHGSGKTTLLRNLKQAFDNEGKRTRSLFISLDVKLPWSKISETIASMSESDILFFDGADHLPFWRFKQLRRLTHKRRIGMIITSHTEGTLPTLVHCRTNTELLSEVVSTLLDGQESIAASKLEDLFKTHNGNIRDCLWQLYDEYSMYSNR